MPVDPIPGRSAADIIRVLDLQPHPEGGFFRETFRDPAGDGRGRAVSTLIYFLLGAGRRFRVGTRSMPPRSGISPRWGALGNKDFAKWQRDKRASSRF